jgi:hypothetical protein
MPANADLSTGHTGRRPKAAVGQRARSQARPEQQLQLRPAVPYGLFVPESGLAVEKVTEALS